MANIPLQSFGRILGGRFRATMEISSIVSFAARKICKICLGVLLFCAIGFIGAAEKAASPDPATFYAYHWLEVTSAIGDISKITLKFDLEKPDPKLVSALKEATDQLENASSELMQAVPPAENSRLHVIALPRLIEIVGASRKVLHELEGKDHAEIAASLQWLDNALLQLQKAVRAAMPPAEKSAPSRKEP